MATALFGVSDYHFSPPSVRGAASQDFSRLTRSVPSSSAGFHGQSRSVSAVSLLAAEKSICSLRFDLIEMLRISLHAVDCATKAYALGLIEFALNSSKGRKKLDYLSQTIRATIQELREAGALDDAQLDFIESARAISGALSSICQHAYEVSSHTLPLLHGNACQNSKELVHLGERANRLLRLCIVAFMKQKVEYAEAVLNDSAEWRRSSMEISCGQEHGMSGTITGDLHKWLIAASLAQIIEDLRTVAAASLFPYRFQC